MVEAQRPPTRQNHHEKGTQRLEFTVISKAQTESLNLLASRGKKKKGKGLGTCDLPIYPTQHKSSLLGVPRRFANVRNAKVSESESG